MRPAPFLTTVALIATFAVPAAAGQRHAKLDESLNDSIARGCKGTKSVIIRTTPGAREALRKSLMAQGRRVKGEFPALDAITAELSCADLKAIAGFRETASVSDNAKIYGHQLGDLLGETMDPIAEDPTTTVVEEPLNGTLSAYSVGSLSTTSFTSSLLSRLMEALTAQHLQGGLFSTLGARGLLASSSSTPSIGIAVIDSGIAPGLDFGSRITAF